MNKLPRYKDLLLLIVLLWAAILISCKKEHSCEGGCTVMALPPPADTLASSSDTIPSPDTSISPPLLPSCRLCQQDSGAALQSWNFKNGNTYLCGNVNEARFIGRKTTITFFGPSSCSADTGLRMTIYLPEPLDGNKSNITTNNVAFYYYDNKALKSILISGASQSFFVTINSFVSATQIASGTFGGTVFTSDGSITSVKEGRFNVKLK